MTPKRVTTKASALERTLARASMRSMCDNAEVLAAGLTLQAALSNAYGIIFTVGNSPVGEVKYFVDRKPVSVLKDRIVVTVRNERKGTDSNQFIFRFGIGDDKAVPVFCKVKLKLINTRTGQVIDGSFQPPADYAGYKDLITAIFDSIPSGTYQIDFTSQFSKLPKFKNP